MTKKMFALALLAGAAWPAIAAAAPADVPADTVVPADEPGEDIVVIGRGVTQQVQQLAPEDFELLVPATSPLKAIQKLPGVNFQSADAFGAYEWSQRVSIRGFNQNQLGFTLDGIPLGDGSYGNTNGLHISRAISSENIGQVRVAQGSGAIGTQATNNLGGTIEFFSSDPKDVVGLTLNGTYGSDDTYRAFGRLDTGVLGADGPSAYVSYGYLETGKWKGFGQQRQNQVNAKAIAPLGAVRLVGTFDFSDRREQDYQDMSLEMIGRLGYDWDNIANDYRTAVQVADVGANTGYTGAPKLNPAAGTTYPAPFANADDAYFDAAGLRTDYLASVGLETERDAPVKGLLRAYYHDNHGRGLWFTPYVPSPSGVPISIRTTEYDIHRKGVFGNVGTDVAGIADVTVGGWYERNDFRQARRFYGLDSRTEPTRDALDFPTGAFATQWDFRYQTDTVQYHVQARIPVGALTVELGWKGYDVRADARPITAGGLAAGKIKTTDWFQPRAGFTFTVNDQAEIFGGFSQVTRAFTASATGGPFATTQVGFDGLGDLKPEQSDTYELGGRFKSGPFSGSLAGYHVDFRNRLLGFANGAGIVGNPAILRNVGGVRSQGVEATGQLRLPEGFGAFASYAYNVSKYRNNIRNADGSLFGGVAIEDKTVVDAPRHIAFGELTVDRDLFFGRIGANYMSRRYFTYSNDQSVPGRVIADASAGVRLTFAGDRKAELQLSATNLFDKEYVATIGSNGFGNSGDNQTLLVGAPRQVFVSLKTGF
jgi:iron complex outermembrane receptor protein